MKILILLLINFGTLSLASASEVYGLLMIVKGQVQVIKPKSAPISVKVGDRIYPQDTIMTGKDSRAKIVMSDRNIINVLPETRLRIDEYTAGLKDKNVRLSLINGKLRTNVEQKYDQADQKFEIKTPSAVIGVRGTQFMTSYSRATNATAVTTFRGEVMFRGFDARSNKASEPIIVKRGEKSESLDGAKPGTPVKISPLELRKIEGDTTVKKNDKPADLQQMPLPKNDIAPIVTIINRNDNLLSDSARNIINKPATVNIIIEQ